MTRTRAPWTVCAVLVGLTGMLAAYTAWPFVAFASAFVWTTLLVAVTAWSYREEGAEPWYRPWVTGLVAAVSVVATIGWCILMGLAGLFLVLLVAAFSPPAVRVAHRFATWMHRGNPAEPDPRPDPPARTRTVSPKPARPAVVLDDMPVVSCSSRPAESMDDEELCWAWRVSYVALQHATSPAARLRAVQTRQEYLDELERRNPEGLTAWLYSGARAAGDPRRYIVEGKTLPRTRSTRELDPSRLRLT